MCKCLTKKVNGEGWLMGEYELYTNSYGIPQVGMKGSGGQADRQYLELGSTPPANSVNKNSQLDGPCVVIMAQCVYTKWTCYLKLGVLSLISFSPTRFLLCEVDNVKYATQSIVAME